MPTQYPQELTTRALHLLTGHSENNPDTGIYTACKEISVRLGIGAETLRNWHKQTNKQTTIDAGKTPGTTSDIAAENRRLRKENAELKRANEILRTASDFSQRNSTDRPTDDLLY